LAESQAKHNPALMHCQPCKTSGMKTHGHAKKQRWLCKTKESFYLACTITLVSHGQPCVSLTFLWSYTLYTHACWPCRIFWLHLL